MRNTFGKLCVILATLVLLFSVAFFTIALILRDNDYIEQKYKELDVSTQMGMSVPDLSRATTALLDYMRGERPNIKVEAKVNGADIPDIFFHEKEVVHMAEVQTLWLGLDAFSKFGAIGAAALLIGGILLIERGKKRAILSSGIFWGCGIFGGFLGFMGVWAILDFSSFWTVFHFIIFPASLFQYLSAGATVQAMNELNWMLPNDSIMVNMLFPIFPPLVLRCAICVIIEIAVVVIAAIFIRFAWRKQGTRSPVADIVVVEHDENEPIPIKGPDLVLAHKLRNAPVSKRAEILRRAKNGEPLEDPPKPFEKKEIPLNSQAAESERLSAAESETIPAAKSAAGETAEPSAEASDETFLQQEEAAAQVTIADEPAKTTAEERIETLLEATAGEQSEEQNDSEEQA